MSAMAGHLRGRSFRSRTSRGRYGWSRSAYCSSSDGRARSPRGCSCRFILVAARLRPCDRRTVFGRHRLVLPIEPMDVRVRREILTDDAAHGRMERVGPDPLEDPVHLEAILHATL